MKHTVRITLCVAACIDMLGVSERMNRWKEKYNEQDDEADSLLQDIHYIRSGFNNSKQIHESKKTGVGLRVQVIGDSVYAIARLEERDDRKPDFREVFYLSVDLSTVMMFAMERGIVCRGAMEIGLIANLPGNTDDSLIGPIHAALHNLEKEAIYPRVLIGPELQRAASATSAHGLDLASKHWYRDSLQRPCLNWLACMRSLVAPPKWIDAVSSGIQLSERQSQDTNLPARVREKYAYLLNELQSARR